MVATNPEEIPTLSPAPAFRPFDKLRDRRLEDLPRLPQGESPGTSPTRLLQPDAA